MPEATRDHLLDAAEQLFAKQGFSAVGVRQITRLANANAASVNYHFGSKLELYRAVLKRRIVPINQERLRRLEEARALAVPDAPPVEAVVGALLRPVYESVAHSDGRPNEQMIQFASRTLLESPEHFRSMHHELFLETRERFGAALQECFPHLKPQAIQSRFFFLISVLAGGMSQAGTIAFATREMMSERDFGSQLDRFIGYATAAIAFEVPGERREER